MKKVVGLFLFFSLIIPLTIIAESASPDGTGQVYVIPVNQDIDPFLAVYLKRSLAKAQEAGAPLVIFELNTFGGRVDSALEITSLIGSANWARTIAYIPSATGGTGVSWSAGALISFSCNQIIMDSGTSIGAAAPVYQSAEGMVMAEEKTISALRGQMAALAEKNGYPRSVALAMVDDDIELYEVETAEGMRLKTPEEISEMERLSGVAPVQGRQITAKDKLLTLTAGEMATYGVSSATVNGRGSLFEFLGEKEEEAVIVERSRSDWFVALISSAAVTSFLLMIGLAALYMEVTSPGFGIPGTVALICFSVIFSASVMMGNLGSLELLLFLCGVILLLIEIFVIPGFGVIGISGIILILISLVLSRQDFIVPQFTWQWDILKKNVIYISVSLFGALTLIGIMMAALPQSRLFSRLILSDEEPIAAGKKRNKSASHKLKESALPQSALESDNAVSKKGQTALAVTDLRPVGKAVFGTETFIVQTEGEYVEKGKEIVVIREEGLHIVVKERS